VMGEGGKLESGGWGDTGLQTDYGRNEPYLDSTFSQTGGKKRGGKAGLQADTWEAEKWDRAKHNLGG